VQGKGLWIVEIEYKVSTHGIDLNALDSDGAIPCEDFRFRACSHC
jgi:hypothetical protein